MVHQGSPFFFGGGVEGGWGGGFGDLFGGLRFRGILFVFGGDRVV